MLSLVEALTPLAASAWAYSSAMTADSVKSAEPTTTAAPLLADPEAEAWPSGPPAEPRPRAPPAAPPPPQAASSREARLTPASAKVLLRFMLYSVSRRVSPDRCTGWCVVTLGRRDRGCSGGPAPRAGPAGSEPADPAQQQV